MPKTQRLSDAALVRRSQQGDRRAFGALASRYDRRLRGLAYALLLDRGQMDAALGLAFLRSWRDILRIKPRDDVGPWLYRAVYNACIDQLRRNEVPSVNRRVAVGAQPGAPGGLRAVLGTLAPADRVALVLIEREGFSVTSAARILGVAPDELETRLDVARDRLAPYVPVPAPSSEADEAATEAPAPAPAEDQEPAPTGEVSGNGAEGHADVDAPLADAPDAPSSPEPAEPAEPAGDPSPAATTDDEPAAAETAAKGNGHAANRGRGRRARRRANGAERQANGAEDQANGETGSDTADPAAGDGSAQPAAATPSAGEHPGP